MDNKKITFYIVRHGQTLMNKLDVVQGWCDSPLTEQGVLVAKQLGLGLNDIQFDAAYCSSLKRTKETAWNILEAKGQKELPIVEVEGFKEACFGGFEAGTNLNMWEKAALFLQFTSNEAMYNAILEKKLTTKQILDAIKKIDKLEMAEDYDTLKARTQKALNKVAERELAKNSKNVLIIAHGMSILGMLQSLGGDKLLKGHLDNAAVCKVIYENREFTVESMGDMSYVEKGKNIFQN